jgi:hypothetical protein
MFALWFVNMQQEERIAGLTSGGAAVQQARVLLGVALV